MSCACAFRVRSFQLAAFSFWPVSICMFSMTLVWCIRWRSTCVPYPDELRSLIQVCKQWTGHDIRARHSEEYSTILFDSTRNYAGRIVTRGAGNLWSSWPRSPMATPNKTSGPDAGALSRGAARQRVLELENCFMMLGKHNLSMQPIVKPYVDVRRTELLWEASGLVSPASTLLGRSHLRRPRAM